MELLVNEIFYSIQGESTASGLPSIFVRLTGCNLNCRFCDTEYAKSEGKAIDIDFLIETIKNQKGFNHITITGGEPLLQENSYYLIDKLCKLKYTVQIETNGSLPIKNLHRKSRKIIDVKTPSSGEENSFHHNNLKHITKHDEFKFIISDMNDYQFSKDFIHKNLHKTESIINFSPAYNSIDYSKLAGLILTDRLDVRLNLQLHKLIWTEGDEGKININF